MKILTYNMQGLELNSSALRLHMLLGVDVICIQRVRFPVANLIEQLLGKKGHWTVSTDYGDQGILTIGPGEVEIHEINLVQDEKDNSQGKRYHSFTFNNLSMIHQYGCYQPVESKEYFFNQVLAQGADFVVGDTHRVRTDDTYKNYKILNQLPTFMGTHDAVCIDWIMSKDPTVLVRDEYVPSIDTTYKMKHYPVVVTL